ncbi:sugar phosphate isomerase/epimerase family protein [Streptosporangium subroseum]|uniref:sugar phosphate isomerase/epimerase family protein n=1 Tax=Streptosporangium subroseum TaxID=106412 RepID=UPI003086E2EC|nr:sugar phosphate isomerase/epimerase [Streptosporangium subroseum]
MRLAFSTLGMPGQGLDEAIATAVEYGCAGLELRLHPDTGVHAGLSPQRRAAIRETVGGAPGARPGDAGDPAFSAGGVRTGPGSGGVQIGPGSGGGRSPAPSTAGVPAAAARLEISALAGYVRIAVAGPDEPVVRALREDLLLAADLGAPAVRVFPGGEDVEAGARRLRAVAGLCAESGVRVLVETHDAMPTGAAVGRLLDAAGVPGAAGALWDVLHPWRHGEEPAQTLEALGEHLAYVQVKDAISAVDTTPVPMWEGGVPLDECGELLRGFGGWVSLEWERTWYPQVAPVEEILPGAREWVARFSS